MEAAVSLADGRVAALDALVGFIVAVVAGLNVVASAWLTLDSPWRLMVMLAAGTAVFFWWTLRFHLRGWLLVAGGGGVSWPRWPSFAWSAGRKPGRRWRWRLRR
ncbi:MAG: hypothetical protein IPG51_04760 [Chloroflexi bacterium]|nr:hypothetical protein [Chloroflexota bacterium]